MARHFRAAAFILSGFLLASSASGIRSLSDLAGAAREQSLERAWSKALDSNAKSPVQRVIMLLKDMKAQLEQEADKESEMYDEMVCWCETNEKEKKKAIAEADAKTSELEASISGKSAAKGTLLTEIADLKGQISEDKMALQTATEIREKELASFSEEEKEMVQTVTNLKNAIFVLSSHQAAAGAGANFLQSPESASLAGVRSVLRDASLKYELMRAGDVPGRRSSQKTAALQVTLEAGNAEAGTSSSQSLEAGGLEKALASVLGEGFGEHVEALPLNLAESILAQRVGAARASGAFVQQPYASYSSASTGIFGILDQMREEFEANLSQAQKDEMKNRADFEALSASKSAQITSGQAKLDELENSYAGNSKALADAVEDFELTRTQRTADVEFLSNLKLTCQSLDKEWLDRSKTRSEETTAVSETLAILTEDDNREHLAKTVAFLQEDSDAEESEQMRARRAKAATALRRAATAPPELETDDLMAAWQGRNGASSVRSPSAELATLAVSVELDSFTRVKEAIDSMVADLKKEQEEEVKTKAYCVKEFDMNAKETYAKEQEKKDLESTLALLAATIEKLTSDIESATTQIADAKLEITKASEAREKANAEFQTIVADQRATQGILTKALARLEAFYKASALQKEAEPTLLQKAKRAKLGQTPPVKFSAYKKNFGSTSVLGFLEQIVEDSKALEAEAVAGEKKAQANYETFVTGSNKLITSLEEEVSDKTKLVASGKVDTEDAKNDHASAVAAIESLEKSLAYLHKECDFLIKNFSARQKARLEEIEAILKAKAILSGM